MKNLTNKEEEIMNFFWQKGPLFVKEIQDLYADPKPHINTISTIVRILEDKGFVGHESLGKTYRYFAAISEEQFRNRTLKGIIQKYFNSSYLGAVSSLIQEEEISVDELKKLVEKVEKAHSKESK